MVEEISRSPLPRLPACDERHFAMCLRMMLAVLPRQQTDEVGGELFVEAYRRHLAEWPDEAISFLASEATGHCKWFPTIAECREILARWHRSDEAARRREHAKHLATRERNLRWNDEAASRAAQPSPQLTEEELQFIPSPLRKLGLSAGWLTEETDGTIRWTEQDSAA